MSENNDVIMLDDSFQFFDRQEHDLVIISDSEEDAAEKDSYHTDHQVIENSFFSLPSASHLSDGSSVDIFENSQLAISKVNEKSGKMCTSTTLRNRDCDDFQVNNCFVPDSDDENVSMDLSMRNDMSICAVDSSPSISSSKSLDSFPDISNMSILSTSMDESLSFISPKKTSNSTAKGESASLTDISGDNQNISIPCSGKSESNSCNTTQGLDSGNERSSNVSNSSVTSVKALNLSSGRQSEDGKVLSLHGSVNSLEDTQESVDSSYASMKDINPNRSLTEKQRCSQKISGLEDSIKKKKDVLKSVDLATLPDRGVRLQLAIASQEKELKQLKLEFNNMPDDDQPLSPNDSSDVDSNSSIIVEQVIKPGVLSVKDMNSVNKPSGKSCYSNTFSMIRGMDSVTMDSLKNLHDSLKTCPAEDVMSEDPKGLKITLMTHQRHGLAWMLWRERQVPSGGILADDMGLGKTLSMISLILKHKELIRDEQVEDLGGNLRGGTLIVCPTSLLGQWKNEIDRRCKQSSLSLYVHHGTDRSNGIKSLKRHDVVITTYGIVMRECASIQKKVSSKKEDGPLHILEWTRIILDEAHVVRNHKSQTSQAVCCLKGTYRWALTGTPIHNKELDLFALIVFLRCSPFDKYMTWRRWVDNKTAAGAQRMNMLMKSLMLRRTKEQLQSSGSLASLPERQFHQIKIDLEPSEQAVYDQILILSRNLFAKFMDQHAARIESRLNGDEPGSHVAPTAGQNGIGFSSGISEIWSNPLLPGSAVEAMKSIPDRSVKSHHLLVLLLRLRQICCHPGLIQSMLEDEDYKTNGIVDDSGLDVDLISQLNSINLLEPDVDKDKNDKFEEQLEKNPLTMKNPVFRLNRPSTKINALFNCLKENVLESQDKAVVVSQWTSVLDLIGDHLKRNGIKYYMLNGSVPLKTRTDIVENFNNSARGTKVLLLSLQAGGVGLNLVGGNHLLLVDLHWNPQLEAQACDRIYRVGQKKEVHIYRFICKHTVEEKIHQLQDKKLTMAENVLTGAKNPQSNKLTLEDLKLLFTSSQPS
ncbi:transcription termination factor 2 [Hetaerina americana]|uniref:transcription termination factor 2 n=1 Tax=Hetaerina americana TaxID=62018 RepID=UPI003A7F42B0